MTSRDDVILPFFHEVAFCVVVVVDVDVTFWHVFTGNDGEGTTY